MVRFSGRLKRLTPVRLQSVQELQSVESTLAQKMNQDSAVTAAQAGQVNQSKANSSDDEFFRSIGLDTKPAAKSVKQTDDELFKSLGIDLKPPTKSAEPENKVATMTNMLSSNLALLSLTGVSVVAGFFGALAFAKRREGATLDKALLPRRGMSESGTKLAFRALGYGTLYAVSGFSVVTYGLYQFTKYRLGQFEQRMKEEKAKNVERIE